MQFTKQVTKVTKRLSRLATRAASSPANRAGVTLHYDDSERDAWALAWFSYQGWTTVDNRCRRGATGSRPITRRARRGRRCQSPSS